MIALVVSAVVAAYLLIPNALFRFLLGTFVPVRAFQGTKTEELTRAVVTLFFIFLLALLAVKHIPFCKDYPFSFPDTPQMRDADYAIVGSSFYSEAMFKDYGPRFWDSLWRTLDRQGRLIFWYYSLAAFFAILLGYGSKYYGKLKRYRPYSKFADIYLLPHVSQWFVVLTPFTFPDRNTVVRVDVLMTDDTLYRGKVADHFVDRDGKLAGLFLENPTRFDRRAYLKEKDAWGITRPLGEYWKPIPSAKLYLFAEKIVNLNVNYEPTTVAAEVVEKYLSKLPGMRPLSVSVGAHVPGPPNKPPLKRPLRS
ncbi:MAG TPA: hypothetical protein VFA71_12135 [Terriglobales bacterium]|nr:hypothetical protein [Terriglobales bacterium]